MKKVRIVFSLNYTATNWEEDSLIIVGQYKHIKLIKYDDLKLKLGSLVTKEVYEAALASIKPTNPSSDHHHSSFSLSTCPLHLNRATLALLPEYSSRHDSPARPRSLTKAVRSVTGQLTKSRPRAHVLIVCPKSYVMAYGAAVSRAFPSFSAKSGSLPPACEVSKEAGAKENGLKEGDLPLNKMAFGSGEGEERRFGEEREVLVEFLIVEEGCGIVGREKEPITERDVNLLSQMGYGIRLTSIIVDMPCNLMSTNEFIQEIQRVGTDLGIVPKIIRGMDLDLKGFGGIYGVGKAAVNPPALVVLSHVPANSSLTIAWVGKGIVYDTGGLSIKSKSAMPGMKRDCGGAAAILGAFYACVKLGFAYTLHAVFCLAENSVGPNATRPDDIHRLYSGKTVEINNTDAEGRLVLADGVAFASNDLGANIVIDVATLTGAQGIAVGKYHSAIVTNDQQWEDFSVEAGKISGDLVFPLPYCPELHFSEFSSALADMKNSVADRNNAQSSCAALFIAANLRNGFEFPGIWAHHDIAAPVHDGERATGYGVALLLCLFGFGSQDPYLKKVCPVSVENLDLPPITKDVGKGAILTGQENDPRGKGI